MKIKNDLFFGKISQVRLLMQDKKARTIIEINDFVKGEARRAIYEMIDAGEILELERSGKNVPKRYQATRHLGCIIKQDIETQTPEGVLILQNIVIQQRALRLANLRG